MPVRLVELAKVRVVHPGRRGTTLKALRKVDLWVDGGQIVALCGRNGAGKTTLLDVVTGLRRPDKGSARVLGRAPHELGPHERARLGVAPADPGMPPAAPAGRLVGLVSALHREPGPVGELLERLELGPLLHRPVRRLSSGQRQRLTVALALIGRPDVLVLDEPTTALDPPGRRVVRELLQEARDRGAAVLWTSHTFQDVALVSDRVVILDGGRVVADSPPEVLTGNTDIVRFKAARAADVAELRTALPETVAIRETSPGRYEVTGEDLDPTTLSTVSSWALANGGKGRLAMGPRELEDVLDDLPRPPDAEDDDE